MNLTQKTIISTTVCKKDLHDPDNHDAVNLPLSTAFTVSCETAALNMPANLENSAVPTGLEKVRFHSNPKEK